MVCYVRIIKRQNIKTKDLIKMVQIKLIDELQINKNDYQELWWPALNYKIYQELKEILDNYRGLT